MIIGSAYIDVRADTDGFAKETESKIGGIAKKAAALFAGAFVVDKAVEFFKGSISAASDLNETLNKTNTIFGQNAAEIDKWSKGAATNLGLSRQKALEAAASFGDMFLQIGFSGDAAAKMSKSTVQLAADMGSFNNLPTADVQQRIAAAFRGEYDSLQAVIPNINAARVESEALAATGKKVAKELTAQEKAAAVLAIVQKDGARAAGDFAKTSDSLANQQKILSARFEDVKAKVGQALLPVMTTLVTTLSKALGPAIDGITKAAKFLSNNFDTLKPILMGVGVAIAVTLVPAFVAWAIAAGSAALATIAAAAPVIAIGAAIALLAAGIIYAYTHFEPFRKVVDTVGRVLKEVFAVAVDYAVMVVKNFIAVVETIIKIVQNVVGIVVALFKGDWATAWDKFKEIPTIVIDLFKKLFGNLVDFIGGRLDGVIDFFKKLPGRILEGLGNLGELLLEGGGKLLAGLWNGIVEGAKQIIEWALAFPGWIKDRFADALSWLLDAGKNILKGLWNGIVEGAKTLIDWVTSFPGWLKDRYVDAAQWLFDAGKKILSGLWNGIVDGAKVLIDWVTGLPKWFKDRFADAVDWMRESGFKIIGGLWNGIVDGAGALIKWVLDLPGWFRDRFVDAAKWLFNAGRDLIQGLINGIAGMAGNIVQALKDFVLDKIPDFVKRFFKLDSPSKLMMGYGRNIAEGLAIGIKQGAPMVDRSLSALTPSLAVAGGIGSFPGMGVGASSGRVVVIQSLSVVAQSADLVGARQAADIASAKVTEALDQVLRDTHAVGAG